MKCRRCNEEIPDAEYNNPVGTGFCYECWVDHITECQKIVESVELDYSDFPEGKEVTVLKLKENKKDE